MQKEIAERINKELGEIKADSLGAIQNNLASELLFKDIMRLKIIRAEWAKIRNACANEFHNMPDEEKVNKICPGCGIAAFEFIFELDI